MKFGALLKAGLICIFATAAQAQSDISEVFEQGASSSFRPSSSSGFSWHRLRISYFGDMAMQPSKKDSAEWFHEPGISYRLSSFNLRFKVPVTQYFYRTRYRSSLFEFGDPTFGISKSNLIRTRDFSLYGSLNFTPATTEYSLTRKQRRGTVGVTLIPSLYLARHLKLDWYSSFKHYIYEPDENLNYYNRRDLNRGRMSQFKAEFRPSLSYRLTYRLQAMVGGHLVFYQNRGRNMNEWARTQNALHFGANYEFARSFSIRPEIRLFDPVKWDMNRLEAGVLLFASL